MGSSSENNILSKARKAKNQTELSSAQFTTKHKVLHGFWMRGDYFIVITNDKTNNSYYLEMYRYSTRKQEMLDSRFILMSKEHVIFDICHCASRRYTSIYVEEQRV